MPITKTAYRISFTLAALPASGSARIPILLTGSWVKGGREFSFTLDDLNTIIANFNKLGNRDLNVDYDHACEDLDRAGGEPTPSAGRISKLCPPEAFTPDADGKARWILYGVYEPTARARTLIQNREYRYTSAAFSSNYPDRDTGEGQGVTLTSVALTNQPFLDDLPEVTLSIHAMPSKAQTPRNEEEWTEKLSGRIGYTKTGRAAVRALHELRGKVDQRAKEKNITAWEALEELRAEGLLADLEREQSHQMASTRRENEAALGHGRAAFADEVRAEQKRLMTSNPALSANAAFHKAAAAVCKRDPALLRNYRKDNLEI